MYLLHRLFGSIFTQLSMILNVLPLLIIMIVNKEILKPLERVVMNDGYRGKIDQL